MNTRFKLMGADHPAIRRLAELVHLDEPAMAALAMAVRNHRPERARRELLREGTAVASPLLLLSGWVARVRLLEDGRRQILSFILPGELVGHCTQPRPLAVSTWTALTNVVTCPAPPASVSDALEQAYAVSAAREEANLLAQITRLGRLSAEERIVDLLLELFGRMRAAGLASVDSFELPLTQEVMADATGLTSVHVNRMLQLLRRNGDIRWSRGRMQFVDAAGLANRVGYINRQVVGG